MASNGMSGLAIGAIAVGSIFVYAGVKGFSVLKAGQNLVQGKSGSIGQTAASGNVTASYGSTGTPSTPAAPTGGGGSPSANKALGEMMAASYGWTGTQWDFLESGWEEESGWSTTAANNPSDPYNGAYGIPQANPGTKMSSEGSGWQTSASKQIAWGLAYIRSTYGSPMDVPNWSANGPLPGYEGY